MLKLGTVVFGAEDVERAVTFWVAALGYEPVRFPEADNDFTILVPPSKVGTRVALQQSATPAQQSPRVHIDLVVDDAAEQAAEISRLCDLGATQVEWDQYPADADFVVLADTEGNRFCVVNAGHESGAV